MGLLSIAILAITVSVLLYLHPEMLRSILPAWFTTSEAKDHDPHQSGIPAPPIISMQDEDVVVEGETTLEAGADDFAQGSSTDVPPASPSGDGDKKIKAQANPPIPSFPAPNRAQRVLSMPPPPRPAPSEATTGLMLPPAGPPAPPIKQSPAAGLRVPATGPLPNRGPPSNSQQRVNGGLAPNGTAVSTPNARGKVVLKPGHSPMDWAALTRSGNISGVSTFQRVTPSELKKMTGRKGKPAWSSWQGKVYNITPYLPFHPGGEAELMRAAGRDGAKLFMDVHPWVNWENMLATCLVGVLVSEPHDTSEESSLDDID